MNDTSTKDKVQAINGLNYSKVLIALELGRTDSKILDYLDWLRQKINMRCLCFMHVLPKVDVLEGLLERGVDPLIWDFQLDEEIETQLRNEIMQRFGRKIDCPVKFDIEEGDPLTQLIEAARKEKADLVIIGQKTSDAKSHGILAKQLARKTMVDTIVIPENTQPKLDKIIVPIDFSANSAKALKKALTIKEILAPDATLEVVYIYELPNFSVYKIGRTPAQFKEITKQNYQDAFKLYFRENNIPEAAVSKFHILEREKDSIASQIHQFIEQEKADLVVIGAKGHSKLELLFLGSVTEKLLTLNEQIPTWVVR